MSQGHCTGPLIVYQDNLSTMALIKRGRPGSERSRHIDIRFFWLKERVDSGEAIIEHKSSADMGRANTLSKAVQGAQFVSERDALSGWK